MIFDFNKVYSLFMEEKKVNYGLILTLSVTLLGWGVTFGVCQNKIENNAREIQQLQSRQLISDRSMLDINKNLAELNSKMDLLLQGRIKFVAEK